VTFIEALREKVAQKTPHCGVFIRLPSHIADQFPKKDEDKSPAHVTLCYIGELAHKDFQKAVEAAREILSDIAPFKIELTDYGEFENPEGQTIAHMIPRAPELEPLHRRLGKAFKDAGIDTARLGQPLKPHVTLGYVEKGRKYDGPRPSGQWRVTEIEMWSGTDRRPIRLEGTSNVRNNLVEKIADWLRTRPKTTSVLAHIAGPSGSGKTTIGDLIAEKYPGLRVVDLDRFDDEAEVALGWDRIRKKDYTDKMLGELAAKRQGLMDKWLSESKVPTVLVGHHTEGPHTLDIDTDKRILLDVDAREAASRAYKRSLSEDRQYRRLKSEIPRDAKRNQEDIKDLIAMGYQPMGHESVLGEIQRLATKTTKTAGISARDYLRGWLRHSALNLGQAARDVRYLTRYPAPDKISDLPLVESVKRRLASLASNLKYTALPPSEVNVRGRKLIGKHHSIEEVQEMANAPEGAIENFLMGYNPWKHTKRSSSTENRGFLDTIQKKLAQTPMKAFLVGSRRDGSARPDSDWDVIVHLSPGAPVGNVESNVRRTFSIPSSDEVDIHIVDDAEARTTRRLSSGEVLVWNEPFYSKAGVSEAFSLPQKKLAQDPRTHVGTPEAWGLGFHQKNAPGAPAPGSTSNVARRTPKALPNPFGSSKPYVNM
jgi:2'-5' RNA ligase/adenylate kinase family enzyme